MVKTEIYCDKSPGRFFGEYRVSIWDTHGKEIMGFMPSTKKTIEADVLEDYGEKALVLFPKGFKPEIGWINLN